MPHLSQVRRLAGAQDPKAWARKECAGGLILSDACVGPAVISQLEAALEEAQSEESWCAELYVKGGGHFH